MNTDVAKTGLALIFSRRRATKKSVFARENIIKVSLPILYWVMIIRRTHVHGSSLWYLKETKTNFPRGGFLSLGARACGLFYICACVGRIYFHMLPGTAAKISQQLRGMCVCGGSGMENPLATLVNNGALRILFFESKNGWRRVSLFRI